MTQEDKQNQAMGAAVADINKQNAYEQTLRYLGYSVAELRSTFKMVTNPHDWRGPIEAVIPTEVFDRAQKAVLYFTGTGLTVQKQIGEMVRVCSIGYRAGPAGDH